MVITFLCNSIIWYKKFLAIYTLYNSFVAFTFNKIISLHFRSIALCIVFKSRFYRIANLNCSLVSYFFLPSPLFFFYYILHLLNAFIFFFECWLHVHSEFCFCELFVCYFFFYFSNLLFISVLRSHYLIMEFLHSVL